MAWFVIFCITLPIAGLLLRMGTRTYETDHGRDSIKVHWRPVGAAFLLVAALALFLSMTVFVSSRQVAIVTSFGRYSSTQEAGIHIVQPWSDAEKFSTRNQTVKRKHTNVTYQNVSQTSADKATQVPGGSGDVHATVRWKIADKDKAVRLWRDYRTFETVKDTLVGPEADTSIKAVFGHFTPGQAMDGTNRRAQGEAVAKDLDKALDRYGVEIVSVTVTDVNVDKDTQKNIDKLASSAAKLAIQQNETRIAQETAKTNAARQGVRTPQETCLDLTKAAIDAHVQLPATWNCGLGSGQVTVTSK